MTTPALAVRHLDLRFGSIEALVDLTFDVHKNELFAVIGPNGAGKSSLFNVLTRLYEPSAGEVELDGTDLTSLRPRDLAGRKVARSFQNLGVCAHLPVLVNVLIGRHHLMRGGALAGGLRLPASRREEAEHRAHALAALRVLGIEDCAQRLVGTLPYGVQKRVELARCIAAEPDLLLLDEPVAGMSASERLEITEVVEELYREREMTIVLVEHDVGMVMRVAQRVLVLDFGHVIALDTPERVQADPAVLRAYLGEEVSV